MNDEKSEVKPLAPAPSGLGKLTAGFAAGALLLSLVNTALLAMNPTAAKVEHANEQLKTDLADSVASLHKKIEGLRSAEIEWQAVLKKAKEKPDALYRITLTPDGFLTLSEIAQEAGAPAAK